MQFKAKQDSTWLLSNARFLAEILKLRIEGTQLRIRTPSRTTKTDTDGWCAVIGNFGTDRPRLEVWFDRFAGYPERKLYACFRSDYRQQITAITKRVDRKLWPVRTVTPADIDVTTVAVLAERLARAEFNVPVLEIYGKYRNFYGFYDPTRETDKTVNHHFCSRAAAFVEDVVHALPHAAAEDERREVYPQIENRRAVSAGRCDA